jgi:hypothetical protein
VFIYFLDGVVYKPPLISYNKLVTTDQKVYKAGDSIFITGHYCFGRETTDAIIRTWTFVDGLVYALPTSRSSIQYVKGCQDVTAYAAVVPKNLPPGKYHMEGIMEYEVNKTRTVIYPRHTNEFEIIK